MSKELFDFMSESPFLTFFLACVLTAFIQGIFNVCINRPLRHANIRKHGWPPEHCDADGDLLTTDD